VGADRIATGHHADDRAETLLIRLLRGTGPVGLAVLPPRDGDRIRPFYRARRADVDAHVSRHHIPHAIDPSNRDPRFLRARVRHELLPVLERLSPRVVEHLCSLADRASRS
jgi:tRNA(Ile)-lysidine synthase